MDDWKHLIPFVGMVRTGIPDINRPIITRIIEQGVIAILAAGFALYISDRLQDHDIEQIRFDIREIKNDVRQLQRDLYIPKTDVNKIN